MQLTLCRLWWLPALDALPLRDRLIARMWKAGEDTVAICDLLFSSEEYVRSRVKQLRDKGITLPKRTRAATMAKRRAAQHVIPCLTCGKPFASEGKHNRICWSCKDDEKWRY